MEASYYAIPIDNNSFVCEQEGKLFICRGRPKRAFYMESGSGKDAEFGNQQPLLAELYSASVSGRVATGPKAG
jgi:hypothetical protein